MGNRRSHQSVRGARSSSMERERYIQNAATKQQSFDSITDFPNANSPDYLPSHEHHLRDKQIGIIQLAFAYLFEQIKRRKIRDRVLYVITVSYLEVYNEQVTCLCFFFAYFT